MKCAKLLSMLLAAVLTLPMAACSLAAEDSATRIQLSDAAVTVDGAAAPTDPTAAVYVGAEIVYYHDGTDESYGEGTAAEMHTEAEAAAHTVVTITQPGTYRLSGSLSQGQIAIDLGDGAKNDPQAVVTLILDNVDVKCTVAPALIFYNVYECDRDYVAYDKGENEDYQPSYAVDTSAAGANVVIAAGSVNTFTGSHVARIYKEGTTKKLHKYDGAFYSRRSMNIFGDDGDNSGVLNIVADNEGLDSELHLTIHGGTVNIQSQDDGINTNEDHVSVFAMKGGSLHINAGNGTEGDAIDSNGYLVIYGGTVFTHASDHSGDGGLDADRGIYLNGGTVSAFGVQNDAADSANSQQPYMQLSFAATQPAGSVVTLTDDQGNTVWTATAEKAFRTITLSNADLQLNTTYHLYVDGVQQGWTGTAFGMGHGGMGGMGGGQRPDGMTRPDGTRQPDAVSSATPQQPQEGQAPDGQQPPELPQGQAPDGQQPPEMPQGQAPDGQQPPEMPQGQMGQMPGGDMGRGGMKGGMTDDRRQPPEGFDPSQMKGDRDLGQRFDPADLPEDFDPSQFKGGDRFGGAADTATGAASADFVLTDTQKSFSGVSAYDADALPFTDLSQSHTAYQAIRSLYQAGAMEGTGGGKFSPDMTLTRAQAITVLARLAGAQSAETDAFSDVEPGSWYSGYVGWAVEKGIVQGDGQGHFYPDMTVTAEHMALMLGRYKSGYQNTTAFQGDLTRAQLAQMAAEILD